MPDEIMTLIYVFAGAFGLCIGSFLNVVIYRLPNGMSLSKPASHCTRCDYHLKWYDNIPVLSYIMLGGKCRKCKQKISPRYIIIELITCAFFLLSVLVFGKDNFYYAILSALLSAVLICVFCIDLEHMYIPDRFQLIIAVLGIGAIFLDSYTVWYDHLIGCFAGGAFFLLLYYGAILVLKKEGLGFGDVKIAFATGLLLGWQKFLLAMIIASVVACFVLVPLRYSSKESQKEFPFGPFIAIGVAVAVFAGAFILNWYTGLLGI